MSRKLSRLMAIDSPFPKQASVLRLLEPPGSSSQSLYESVVSGTYDKPFIVDCWPWRYLHFDFHSVQSAMHLADPDKLCFAYTRKMMLFLLFNRTPRRILLLGLGGGSLAKFCYRWLPHSAVTAIEINPTIIALRKEFRIPEDDERFRVLCADGSTYVAHLPRSKDVILVDACDAQGVAPQLDCIEFYENARRCLSPGGVFVSNLCGDWKNCASHLRKIADVFGDDLLALKVRDSRNLIVIAFKEPRAEFDWDRLQRMAIDLKRHLGLNFERYLRRMAQDWSLHKWRRPPALSSGGH
jgi:spermidine synthase